MCRDPEVGNERRLVCWNFSKLAGRLIQGEFKMGARGFQKSLQRLVWILLS